MAITQYPSAIEATFELKVARGQLEGHRALSVFGYNQDIDTVEETVWPDGSATVLPTSSLQMTVSSSSANDTAAGTGARTLLVSGLDNSYNEISETVSLNGTTAVTTTLSYIRINKLTVATAGSDGKNDGVVYIGTGTVTAGVPATIYNLVAATFNSSTSGLYTVPAGYTAYMYSGSLTVGQSSGTNPVTGKLIITPPNGLRYVEAVTTLNNGNVDYDFAVPLVLPEKYTIEASAVGTANNNTVASYFNLMLIDNDN